MVLRDALWKIGNFSVVESLICHDEAKVPNDARFVFVAGWCYVNLGIVEIIRAQGNGFRVLNLGDCERSERKVC